MGQFYKLILTIFYIFNYIKIIFFLWHFPTNIPWKPLILKTSWHFPKKIISWDQYLWQGLRGSTYIHGADSSPLHTTLAWFSACSKTDHSFARSLPVSPHNVNEKRSHRMDTLSIKQYHFYEQITQRPQASTIGLWYPDRDSESGTDMTTWVCATRKFQEN